MRHSQTEIFGLAFIVILLTMGIFFGLFFFIGNKTTPSVAIRSVEADNWVTAVLNTLDEECQGATVGELLQTCAQGDTLLCSNGQRSCERAHDILTIILSGTLEQWDEPYHLRVRHRDNPIPGLDDIGQPCPGRRRRGSGYVALLGQQPLQITLDLCV